MRNARPGSLTTADAVSLSIRRVHLKAAKDPPLAEPDHRRLRVYAYDPSLEADIATLGINEAMISVRWEDVEAGPIGEYLEVIDVDPASRMCYAPVDLNHPSLLIRDGLPPSEANPQFHQQMVYAVAMKTIEHFERALGRVSLWSPCNGIHFVQRLRIYPHALREENAYYSPDKKALLFGYFPVNAGGGTINPQGTLVFSCLSNDIIAHETAHALLDGLHRRYRMPSGSADMAAFHEAFADIVALFQHFTVAEALRDQIRQTRGNLQQQSILGKLAIQFGDATSGHGALRDYIGKIDNTGAWKPREPRITDYADAAEEPHRLGAVLVSAVFDAFIQIYTIRAEELMRLVTGGTGILAEGAIPSLLVDQLAREASKVAAQFLQICIRALDYCPPVELSFGDYLRAMITADRDVVPDDRRSYRVALVSAFRKRGIMPEDVRHLSVGSLIWEPPPQEFRHIGSVLSKMDLSWDLNVTREQAWKNSHDNAWEFYHWLRSRSVSKDEIAMLGLHHRERQRARLEGVSGRLGRIDVHSVRPATRVMLDGRTRTDLVVEITQSFYPDEGRKARGGATLLIDLETNQVRYLIRKRIERAVKLQKERAPYATGAARASSLRASYFAKADPAMLQEPFALVHRSFSQ